MGGFCIKHHFSRLTEAHNSHWSSLPKARFGDLCVCVCVCVCVLVTQLYPALCDTIDCSLPGSSVDGILQARMLEWVTIPFSTWWLRVSCNWLGKLGNTTNQNFLPPSFPFCFSCFSQSWWLNICHTQPPQQTLQSETAPQTQLGRNQDLFTAGGSSWKWAAVLFPG